MDANEFIKVFGLDIARMAINECPAEYDLDTIELKRLVESHELLEEEGGIDEVKYTFSFALKHGVDELTEYGKRLKQSIADVESCQ